jgi:hypothetical protein
MLSYNEAAALAAAPTNSSIDPNLRSVLRHWAAADLLDLTYLVIVQPGDSERTLLDTVGYSPLVDPLSGKRFGDEGFVPSFDWLKLNGQHYELIETVSNDGFAFVLFIPDSQRTDPQLLQLCRTFGR